MQKNYHILMGDLTRSSDAPSQEVAAKLEHVVGEVNEAFAPDILSPLTVTLGDEFQGIAKSAEAAASMILAFEHAWIKRRVPDLHYSWVWGPIATDINPDIAHGMMGPGLTEARSMLTRKDRDREKVQVSLADRPEDGETLQNVFLGLTGISGRWKEKDFALVGDLLETSDIAKVAARHDRDKSSVYRRRETLMIEPYQALTRALLTLASQVDRETGLD